MDRPEASEDAEELFEAFFNLMDLRSAEWITILDIEAYMRLFPIPQREWFPRLILGAQRAHAVAVNGAREKTKRLTTGLQDKLGK